MGEKMSNMNIGTYTQFVEMPTYKVNIDIATGERKRKRLGTVYIKDSEIFAVDMEGDTACIYTNGEVWRVDADDAMKVLKCVGYATLEEV